MPNFFIVQWKINVFNRNNWLFNKKILYLPMELKLFQKFIIFIYKKVERLQTLVGKFLLHFIILLPNLTTDNMENEKNNKRFIGLMKCSDLI